MLLLVTSLCTTYSGRDREQPCHKLREKETSGDRCPVFIIFEVLFLIKTVINKINIFEYPIVFIVYIKKYKYTLSNAFSYGKEHFFL